MSKVVRIAVVEDDKPIREMYELKLKQSGFEVEGAEDGKQGLKLIENFRPDLILLDLRMPVMDGTKMLRLLREKGWAKNILVVVLTNISQNEAPMELRLLDVKRYLVKVHYTPQQVVNIVIEILRHYNKIKNHPAA